MGHLAPSAFLSYFLLHQAFFGKKKLEQIGLGKAAISNQAFLANGKQIGLGEYH